jgi:hypothetical protein
VLDGANCVIVTYDAAKHVDSEEDEKKKEVEIQRSGLLVPERGLRFTTPGTIASDGGEEHFGSSIIDGSPGLRRDVTPIRNGKVNGVERKESKATHNGIMRSVAVCNFFDDGQDVWNAFAIAVTVCCARDEMVKRLKVEGDDDKRGRKRRRSDDHEETKTGEDKNGEKDADGDAMGSSSREKKLARKRRRMAFDSDEDA